jgi:hypothetical protein
MRHNLDFWLEEQDPQVTNQAAVRASDQEEQTEVQGSEQQADNEVAPPEDQGEQRPPEDVSSDPESPDMPEERGEEKDFEVWKSNYFKESIKGDASNLMELLSPLRNREGLEPYQRKFVDDNWNVQLIRQNANVAEASKQIRKSIRDQLDRSNPATSVVNHLFNTLQTVPTLNETFIRMMGYAGNKGELHRKFLAALTSSVQVSSSPDKENIIFNDKDYSIKISTRLNSDWGEVALGSWSLREDDAERYLSEPELRRLSEGSPQERDVLRRRVVIESIAKHFDEQAFVVNVVSDDGTIYYLGWDVSNAIRGAYADGKIVVKTVKSENSEAMISDDGQIVPMVDLKIYFVKETDEQDEYGNPKMEEIEFMEKRNGTLFLTAGLVTVREAAGSMQGTEFKEMPYQGNPSDLKALKRCVYSAHDMLMRQC